MTIAMPVPLRLYLVRHGETEWSLTGQHTGRTDLPLTERGEDEARHFALGTASLSILGYNPQHPEVAVIALWNAAASEMDGPMSYSGSGDAKTVNPRAIARWENEGGGISAGAGVDFLKKNKR